MVSESNTGSPLCATHKTFPAMIVSLLLKSHLTLKPSHTRLINHNLRIYDRLLHSLQLLNDQRKLNLLDLVFSSRGSRLKFGHIWTVTNIGSNFFCSDLSETIAIARKQASRSQLCFGRPRTHSFLAGSLLSPSLSCSTGAKTSCGRCFFSLHFSGFNNFPNAARKEYQIFRRKGGWQKKVLVLHMIMGTGTALCPRFLWWKLPSVPAHLQPEKLASLRWW